MVASAFSSDNERQEVPVGMCGGWMCLAELWSSNRRQLNELTSDKARFQKQQETRRSRPDAHGWRGSHESVSLGTASQYDVRVTAP